MTWRSPFRINYLSLFKKIACRKCGTKSRPVVWAGTICFVFFSIQARTFEIRSSFLKVNKQPSTTSLRTSLRALQVNPNHATVWCGNQFSLRWWLYAGYRAYSRNWKIALSAPKVKESRSSSVIMLVRQWADALAAWWRIGLIEAASAGNIVLFPGSLRVKRIWSLGLGGWSGL